MIKNEEYEYNVIPAYLSKEIEQDEELSWMWADVLSPENWDFCWEILKSA